MIRTAEYSFNLSLDVVSFFHYIIQTTLKKVERVNGLIQLLLEYLFLGRQYQ